MPIEFQNRTGQGGFTLTKNANGGGLDIIQVSAYVPPPPSVTPSASVTPSISITPSITVSVTPSVTVSETPSISITPSVSVSVTPPISITPSTTVSVTPSISVTPSTSVSTTPAPTVTPTRTPSVSTTPAVTVTPSVSTTPAVSVTPTTTPTRTPSVSVTTTPAPTVTPSVSISSTPAPTVTPSVSVSSTPAPTVTPSASPSPSVVTSGLTWWLDASNESLATDSAWYNIVNTNLYGTPTTYNGGSNPVITTSGGIRYYQYTGTTAPAAAFLGGGFHVLSVAPATDYSTTSAWFNNNTNSPKVMALGSTGWENTQYQGVEMFLNGIAIGLMSTRITTDGNTSNSDISSAYNYNQWYQLTQTFDGTTQKMYINGSLYTSASKSGVQNKPNRSYAIGASYTGAGTPQIFLNAALGHYLIYNRALTDAEVLQNYNATRSKFGL